MGTDFIEFARMVSELKRLKRTGWVIKDVKAPESVADHSFMLAILAYAYSKKLGLNTDKCIRMALVHDICEVYSGDIPNRIMAKDMQMPVGVKRKLEEEGLKKIISLLPKKAGKEMLGLWKEFEAGKSREAMLVKDLDKLEMCMQALEYAKAERSAKQRKKFAEFFEDGAQNIKTPEIRGVFGKIRAEFEGITRKKGDVI